VTCHRQRSTNYQRLTQTSERARFGALWHFVHIMWTG